MDYSYSSLSWLLLFIVLFSLSRNRRFGVDKETVRMELETAGVPAPMTRDVIRVLEEQRRTGLWKLLGFVPFSQNVILPVRNYEILHEALDNPEAERFEKIVVTLDQLSQKQLEIFQKPFKSKWYWITLAIAFFGTAILAFLVVTLSH